MCTNLELPLCEFSTVQSRPEDPQNMAVRMSSNFPLQTPLGEGMSVATLYWDSWDVFMCQHGCQLLGKQTSRSTCVLSQWGEGEGCVGREKKRGMSLCAEHTGAIFCMTRSMFPSCSNCHQVCLATKLLADVLIHNSEIDVCSCPHAQEVMAN